MNKKILFYNETEITNKNFKSMMFYRKFYCYRYITIIKLAICFFIICLVVRLNFNVIDKAFCLFMSILGIIDTFRVKEIQRDEKNIIKYEFFEEYFQVENDEADLKVPYKCIEKLIDTQNYYYIIIEKFVIILEKNGFTLGNKDEIKDFIKYRMEEQKSVV